MKRPLRHLSLFVFEDWNYPARCERWRNLSRKLRHGLETEICWLCEMSQWLRKTVVEGVVPGKSSMDRLARRWTQDTEHSLGMRVHEAGRLANGGDVLGRQSRESAYMKISLSLLF